MRAKTLMLTLTAAALAMTLPVVPAAAQHHGPDHGKQVVMKSGKKGEIHLRTAAKAGDVMLEAGTYRIQHRVEGDRHFVRFVPVGTTGQEHEVACRVEPLQKKARFTSVAMIADGNLHRVTRVEVRGERWAHLF